MADWQSLARKAAHQAGVDPNIFVRLVRQESHGDPTVTSPKGAYGYTQLMPDTARGLGVNPRDPWQNLVGGARYLKQQLTRFGNYSDALRAYNAGPGAVQQSHGYRETNDYVRSILGGANPTSAGTRTTTAPAGGSTPTGVGGGLAGPDSSGGVDVSALLSMLNQKPAPPSSMPLQAPSFTAGPSLPQGYQAPVTGGGPAPKPDINQLLALVQTQPPTGATGAAPAAGGSSPAAGGGAAAPAGTGGGALTKPTGIVNFGGKPVAAWIAPALQWARQHGWKGTVTSGYRDPNQVVTPSPGHPVAPQGHSNHSLTAFPGGAVDVSDAPQLAQILAGSPWAKLLKYAGPQDDIHFSHPHGGHY